MNKIKGIILSILITILMGGLLALNFYFEDKVDVPNHIYQVYLDGVKIGLINSKDELYNLINKEQVAIKDQYDVDQVYPPKGFQIIQKNTYDDEITSVENVYESIKDVKQFTIKGYTVTIKTPDENAEPIYIYVLDKNVFEKAVENIIEAFITQERYVQYKEGTQPEINDVGYLIENMYFDDSISIKESYISVDETIYTNVDDLTRYLLFGENTAVQEYTVVQGDTIEKIAEANKLNPTELLIANQNIKSTDTLLAIGQKLDVSLIKPVLTLKYDEFIVEDVEEQYQTIYQDDSTQYTDYRKTIQNGSNGINRISSRTQYTNGEENQGRIPTETKVIKATQDEIIVRGTKQRPTYLPPVTGEPFETGTTWFWPTNRPYIITSTFGYRWGDFHQGNDISGTGYKSPIYAALDGTVVQATFELTSGCYVVIRHNNGYLTFYGHLATKYNGDISYRRYSPSECDMIVSVGQQVSRGQKIGKMGKTGTATGVHLHFALYYGSVSRANVIDSLRLWR